MLYLYILIGILAVAIFITIIVATIIEVIKARISKEIITRENLSKYEDILANYLDKYKLSRADLLELCKGSNTHYESSPLNIQIEEIGPFDKRLKGGEAVVDKNNNGGYTILVADNLSTKSNRFAVAHEIGHIVMGDKLPVGRRGHGLFIRSKNEQIRDYIAAAILLPMEEFSTILEKINYDSLDKRSKMKFIKSLSDERDVDQGVVMKRIKEYKTIIGKVI